MEFDKPNHEKSSESKEELDIDNAKDFNIRPNTDLVINPDNQDTTVKTIKICTGDTQLVYTFERDLFKRTVVHECSLSKFGPKFGNKYVNSKIIVGLISGNNPADYFPQCEFDKKCSTVGCWCEHVDLIPAYIGTYKFLRCYCKRSTNPSVELYLYYVRQMLRDMLNTIRYTLYCKYTSLQYNGWYTKKYPVLAERDKYVHICTDVALLTKSKYAIAITTYRMLFLVVTAEHDFKCANIPPGCVNYLRKFVIEPTHTNDFPTRTLGDVLSRGFGNCYRYAATNYSL